jgi:hypothetical protein
VKEEKRVFYCEVSQRRYLIFCVAVDNSSSESSEDDEGQDDGMGKPAAGGEDIHNEAFWELDLNPDLPS